MSPRNDVAAAAMNGVELVASWLTPTVLFCVLNLMIGAIFFLKPPQQRNDQHQPKPRLVRVSSFLERVKAYNLSTYQSPQPDPAAPQTTTKPDNLDSYRSLQPQPAARELEVPHHARSKSDAMDNAMNLSNYEAPQSEPAAREHVDSHHVGRSKPESMENAFKFPSYHSPQREPEARVEDPHHAPDAVANAFDFAMYESQRPEAEEEEPHHVTRTTSDAVVKAAPAARALKKSLSEKISMVEEEEEDEERWRPSTVRERTAEDEEVDGKADDFINKFRQQLKLQRMDSNLRYDEMLNRGTGRWR
ncbi:pathogen-associated molecular patterns-induced protein A70-like [Salvia miltiorrhiza]|uniref:pathogen-associated molecular patterns-induced protein A70-like n=1 Tax=Salvia miltiorrhiza TaxID=226208 RepID=UPI0025AD0B03|nr:pathogen-associated molecular patterns-induced protein A70-like [Salvia miltiorrhiza]